MWQIVFRVAMIVMMIVFIVVMTSVKYAIYKLNKLQDKRIVDSGQAQSKILEHLEVISQRVNKPKDQG